MITGRGRDRQQAFSILEALITMFLVLTVLVVFASLGRQYSRLTRHSSGKQLTMQAATTGLEFLARELRGAVGIALPTGRNQTSSVLNFTIVDENQTDRLFPSTTLPRTPILQLNAPARLLRVEYSTVGQNLQRRVADSGGLLATSAVAFGVSGFACQWKADHTANVTLSVQEGDRLRNVSHTILLLEGF